MLNNRVLRLNQNPKGILHCSVFFTFNGKLGPSSITMMKLEIYMLPEVIFSIKIKVIIMGL